MTDEQRELHNERIINEFKIRREEADRKRKALEESGHKYLSILYHIAFFIGDGALRMIEERKQRDTIRYIEESTHDDICKEEEHE